MATEGAGSAMVDPALSSAKLLREVDIEEFYKRMLEVREVRPDGRALREAKEASVSAGVVREYGVLGSAIARTGRCSMLCVLTAKLETPGDTGSVDVQVHFPPLCSPRFSIGKPTEKEQALASRIQSILCNSCIDLDALVIQRDVLGWKLLVDIMCLDYDGGALDAALLGVSTCLCMAKIPLLVSSEEQLAALKNEDRMKPGDGPIPIRVSSSRGTPLKLRYLPFGFSYAEICDGNLITDPTAEEEDVSESCATICVSQEGQLVNVYIPGGAGFSRDSLRECISAARDRAAAHWNLVLQAIEKSSKALE
jgi:exosome complex component RRP43